jgi:hypothetical protein
MSWLQPLAFLGLLLVAIPIVVHLFGRPRARRVQFPTLRFLELTRDAPSRRALPSDLLLLALRIAIVAVAVLALARPTWTALGGGNNAPGIARVVVLDTSASMVRLTSDGVAMVAAGRRLVDSLTSGATEALVVESARPGDMLHGASAWLSERSGRKEVVVISDFQSGSFQVSDTGRLDPGAGLSFIQVTPAASDSTVRVDSRLGDIAIAAEAVRRQAGTSTTWRAARTVAVAPVVRVLADSGERAIVDALLEAVASVRAQREGPGGRHGVAVVLPSFSGREALLASTRLPDEPWQGDVLLRLSRHPLLQELRREGTDGPGGPVPAGLTPVLRAANGNVIVTAGVAPIEGEDAVVLVPTPGTTPLLWAGLVAAGAEAALVGPAIEEQDPATVPTDVLRSLEREAAPGVAGDDAPSAARWLWVAALLLLGTEWLVRRRPPRQAEGPVDMVRHERVA